MDNLDDGKQHLAPKGGKTERRSQRKEGHCLSKLNINYGVLHYRVVFGSSVVRYCRGKVIHFIK